MDSSKDPLFVDVYKLVTTEGHILFGNSSVDIERKVIDDLSTDRNCSDSSECLDTIRRIISRCDELDGTPYRWIADVIPQGTITESRKLTERMQRAISQRHIRGGAVIWHEASEGRSHSHVYHICPFHSSHCRCRFFGGVERRFRGRRRVPFLSRINNQEYWENWIKYFVSPERYFLYLAIGEIDFTNLLLGFETLREHERVQEDGSERSMESGNIPCQGSDQLYQIESNANKITQRFKRSVNQGSHTISRSQIPKTRKITSHLTIVKEIEKFVCTPIESTCDLTEWINDEILSFYDRSDPDYRRACSTIRRKTSQLSLNQLWELYKGKKPYFQARDENYYYSLQDSIDVLQSVIDFQYGGDASTRFITKLFNIVEKRIPKKNAMVVVGPPNCGKSYFFDAVCSMFWNVGALKNMVRGEPFPFNDVPNRRICIWNEPNVVSGAMEDLKMLFGGDPLVCNVKFSPFTQVMRTPIIVTSNNQIIQENNPAFKTRCYFEYWKTCPMLKEHKMKPYPMAMFYVFAKYHCFTMPVDRPTLNVAREHKHDEL
ncbi:uncharacterized protein LOC141855938 [Brevipalpus obovatus]|uniref:uncharacterized protein LOC141855938 n=1 Tax=Brevipalpus obovatus TaxID=246614 RepID=UPI003D9FA7C2